MVILQIALNVASALFSAWTEGVGTLSMISEWVSLAVQSGATTCTPESCPGSQFSPIAASWANIGYVTHSDVLNYISTTKFGLWAPLLYVCAALGALIGVAINMPMRNYVWFMLGPAIYGFLIGTTSEVQGVNWVVANQAQDMKDVWRDAEAGLANTDAATNRGALQLNGREGPTNTYVVAYPMVFLDELFSATSNLLIDWLGVYQHAGTGGANSNLAAVVESPEGPWYLLSGLKWTMLENIVAVNLRNPDFRDAFVTFLGSECGDAFKKGIDSGKYIAASSPYGKKETTTVYKGRNPYAEGGDFNDFVHNLDTVAIPTPRSLARMFEEGTEPGQFGGFSPIFDGTSEDEKTFKKQGRTQSIVCSEYLYSIVQMFRFEGGHWYWQMLRSCPNGLSRDQCLRTLFYGWDVRRDEGGTYATPEQMRVFVKNLILVYLMRNEMLFAPQITEVSQRFAPSEQSRSFSEAHVRTMGSKSKYQELYNWAVLMPHMQGILVYFLVIAYPFAAMVMVLPGYYKTFFTWVSFFAWVKLWDVGFAVVTVLERSVWAMLGNTTTVATMANTLIKMSDNHAGTGVGCDGSNVESSKRLADELCAVPKVCSLPMGDADSCDGTGSNQFDDDAWGLLDKLLLLGAGADLDLANGYYIYIMAALYFAVPAVTGQLVLGAKAGASSMLNSAIGGVAGEAGRAAMSGYQHQLAGMATSNSGSIGQAAYAKGMRQAVDDKEGAPSFAAQAYGQEKAALDQQFAGANAARERNGLQAKRDVFGAKADGRIAGMGFLKDVNQAAQSTANSALEAAGGNGGGGKGAGGGSALAKTLLAAGFGMDNTMLSAGIYGQQAQKQDANAFASAQGAILSGRESAATLRQAGHQQYAGNLSHGAEQHAQTVAWEARNQFAAHASGMAGIAGMNSGALSPGAKPQDAKGLGMSGTLDAQRSGKHGGITTGRSLPSISSEPGSASSSLNYSGGEFLSNVGKMAQNHETEFGNLYEEQFSTPTLPRVKGDAAAASAYVTGSTAVETATLPLELPGLGGRVVLDGHLKSPLKK